MGANGIYLSSKAAKDWSDWSGIQVMFGKHGGKGFAEIKKRLEKI